MTVKGSELGKGEEFSLHSHFSQGERDAGAPKKIKQTKLNGIVVIGVRVYQVSDINASSHSFRATFRVFYEWKLGEAQWGSLGGPTDGDEVDVDEAEVPEITLMNAVEVNKEAWQRPPRVMNAELRVVQTHRQYTCVLYEGFELNDFPFDVQRLHIK